MLYLKFANKNSVGHDYVALALWFWPVFTRKKKSWQKMLSPILYFSYSHYGQVGKIGISFSLVMCLLSHVCKKNSMLNCYQSSAINPVFTERKIVGCYYAFNNMCSIDLKIYNFHNIKQPTLWCRKRGMCGKRVMVAHLGCVLCLKRVMTAHL